MKQLKPIIYLLTALIITTAAMAATLETGSSVQASGINRTVNVTFQLSFTSLTLNETFIYFNTLSYTTGDGPVILSYYNITEPVNDTISTTYEFPRINTTLSTSTNRVLQCLNNTGNFTATKLTIAPTPGCKQSVLGISSVSAISKSNQSFSSYACNADGTVELSNVNIECPGNGNISIVAYTTYSPETIAYVSPFLSGQAITVAALFPILIAALIFIIFMKDSNKDSKHYGNIMKLVMGLVALGLATLILGGILNAIVG